MKIVVLPVNDMPRPESLPKGDRLVAMRALVGGGWLEAVTIAQAGLVLWIDEDGKAKDLPVNRVATMLAHGYGALWAEDVIVGPAFVTGLPDDEGNTTPVSEHWQHRLCPPR